ncbi:MULTISPECIES: PIN domain-containing protein [unclassified Nostoc]|uniref:PIN domain-containing protein n=1 Tax=unclassified Nostoc TaxID=2593658 RepID=UPI002AD4F6D1|nr:PIN domain-containing protein [Nostoc sp. DedQUE03]MDZ7975931.1 PIN domain-containing protein [Nostoc sp. DedQUE03]MDZ8044766.1 PIN domain-containing protein [Nostoc sp. DedQUE02]
MNASIIDEVTEQLKAMPQHLQLRVLEFARSLVKSEVRGTPGQKLLRFTGSIPPEDIQLMRAAIEQDCEQVDINECGRYLLDTNIIIALFADEAVIKNNLGQANEVFIPSIAIGELCYGAENQGESKRIWQE